MAEGKYNPPPPYKDISPLDHALNIAGAANVGQLTVGYGEATGGYSADGKQFDPKRAEANPKTLVGRLKVAMLSVIPPAALVYLGLAMQDGAKKYGPYNWRETKIETMVYIDAAMRHLMEWSDGQEVAEDSGVPHLAHAMATIAILVDAIENDSVIETRPKVRKEAVSKLLAKWKRAAT